MDKGSGDTFLRWMTVALVVICLTLVAGGTWFYRSQERQYNGVAMDQLFAIGKLKAEQISNWRQDRLSDAAVLSESPFLKAAIAPFLAAPDTGRAEQIRTRFRSLVTHYHYADVLLVNPEGRVCLGLRGHREIHREYLAALAEAFRTGTPVLTALHSSPSYPAPHLSVVTPIFDGEGHDRKHIGAIVLVSDASQFLYPLIQTWPTPSTTGETLLVIREGDNALILNNLRHAPGAALKMRIPLNRTDVPGVMASLGKRGIVTGRDYRGAQVVAAIMPVPGSPWHMVAKMDREELFADWHARSFQFLLLLLAVSGCLVTTALAFWQHNRKAHFHSLYLAKSQLHASLERHTITLRAIGDAVISTDHRGRVELMNPAAEALTGWTQTEAAGKALADVFPVIHWETGERLDSPATEVLRAGVVVHAGPALLMAKDGRMLPIAHSAAPIRDDSGATTGVVLVFRDQTEERRVHQLLQARLTLLDYATRHSLDELLTRALDEVGALVGSPIGFYHFVDADQQTISLQQWSSRTQKEFCRADGHGLHYPITSAGVWADCVREARPVVHNDYASLPHRQGLPEGHADVTRELVVPIMRQGKIVSILGVGNKPSKYTDNDVETVAYLADVTWEIIAQKRTGEALHESESFRNTLLDAIPVPVFYKDRNGHYLGFNRAFETFFGTPRERLIGKSIFDISPPELAQLHHTMDVQVFESGEVLQYDAQMRSSQGVMRDVIFSKAALIDGHGIINGLIGAVLDITERKQADDARRQSENRFRLLVESSPDAIFVHTGDYFTYLNRAALKLFGAATEQELLGKPVLDRVHPDSRENVRHRIRLLNEERVSVPRMEELYLRLDGTPVPVEISAVAIPYEGSDGALVFVRDITEHKLAEEALHESEERFRRVSSMITDIAYSCTLDENGVYGLSWLTGATERISGYSVEELKAEGCWRFLVLEEDLPLFDSQVTGLAPGSHGSCELRIRHRNGTTVWIASYAECVTDPKYRDRSVLYGALVDIDAHKRAAEEQERLQEQLNQAQKMESVGRLAGGVAHDFNNMLGVILGHTELALMKTAPGQPLYVNLQAIDKAARHSADLTRQLLTFARKQAIAPRELDMNETVQGMLGMLERLIGEDVDLAWLPGTGVWPVSMDPVQINQILTNLCVNARDAISGVGRITIETSNASIDESYCAQHPECTSGEFVLLAISDSGCGMDRETLDNIFDPFFTTKGIGKGTGLGLATVYGIVKQNNGFINVHSQQGQGTTFWTYLPRHISSSTLQQMIQPEPARHGHETILLVEDETDILEIGTTLLESLGYRVLATNTPGDALSLALEHPDDIHLLLTDVIMPEMNGRELNRKIMALYPDIVSLFMSGYTADVISTRGVLDEGVNFIQKPFSMHDLATKVREALDKKSPTASTRSHPVS